MSLYIKQVTLYPEPLNQIESKLNHGQAALYYTENVIIRDFALSKGATSHRIPDALLTSYQPKEIIIGLLERSEVEGAYL